MQRRCSQLQTMALNAFATVETARNDIRECPSSSPRGLGIDQPHPEKRESCLLNPGGRKSAGGAAKTSPNGLFFG